MAVATEAGIDAAQIAVGGDSAGANLSVALINQLRADSEEVPACAWLVSPWTDLSMSGQTMATKDAVDPLMHKGHLQDLADAYVPAGMDPKDPNISVVNADLAGLPPTLSRWDRRRRCWMTPADSRAQRAPPAYP